MPSAKAEKNLDDVSPDESLTQGETDPRIGLQVFDAGSGYETVAFEDGGHYVVDDNTGCITECITPPRVEE